MWRTFEANARGVRFDSYFCPLDNRQLSTRISYDGKIIEYECEFCGYRGGMNLDRRDPFRHAIPYSCPKCQSFQIDIEKGRECHLKKIQALR